MKIIYENIKPKFAIGYDNYQWILAKIKRKRGEWTEFTYHPNLSNLLDELSEYYFKKNTKRIKELKELDNSISKVYNLITEVSKGLETIRVTQGSPTLKGV